MKRKNILMLGCLAGLLLLSACSSEENMADTGNKIDVAKGIRFQFTEEGFEPGEVAAAKQGTRALAEPQEIDLGNGIIAEATLEPDTAGCAQTRAGNPVPDGTYKIYAIDAGGTRHDGLTGTMTGGVFTPSGHWELEAGTYTFVCINSAVTDNGNELYVNMGQGRFKEDNDNPLIGIVPSVVVTNPNDVIVNFVMRHQQARVRYGFVSYTEPIVNFDFDFDTDGDLGGDIYYDLQGNKLRNGTVFAHFMREYHIPVHQDRAYAPSSLVTEYLHTTDYVYVSPDLTARVFANVNAGSIYGRTITTPRQYYFSLGTLQKNHSYIWKLKYKNKDPWYLYNDGTIGSLGKKTSTHVPIGIVVKEKASASDQGTACALEIIKDPVFPNPVTHGDAYAWEDETKTLPSNPDHLNTTVYNGIHDGQSDMNGYNWTWDANSTKDHVVRGEAKEKYPAFYQAGHYTPSNVTITGANIGKWYIPAAGEVVKLIQRFGAVTTPANEPWRGYSSMAQTDMDKMIAAFHAVNNTLQMYGQFFWTSTVCDAANTGFFGPYLPASFYFYNDGRTWWPTFSKVGANFYILPFVHF